MTPDIRRNRKETLKRTQRAAALLLKRFPEHMTLAELNAALVGHLHLLQGSPLTVSELAEMTGQHRQTISRWIKRAPNLNLVEHPEDGRSKLIESSDLEAVLSYLDDIG